MVHSRFVAWTLGATFAAWLPIGVVAAAVWSMRSTRGHAGRLVLTCVSWPLWVLGIALADFASDLSYPAHSFFAYEAFVTATRRLDGSIAPILFAAFAAAAVIGWQFRPLRRRSWQIVCAATLISGSFAFWSTRARALDTAVSLSLTDDVMWGRNLPKMPDLPKGAACTSPTPGAIDLRIERPGGRVDGWDPLTYEELFQILEPRLVRREGGDVHLRVAVDPDVDATGPLSRLDALLAVHKNVTAEYLYRVRLPAVHSQTQGHTIPRIRLCVLPEPLRTPSRAR